VLGWPSRERPECYSIYLLQTYREHVSQGIKKNPITSSTAKSKTACFHHTNANILKHSGGFLSFQAESQNKSYNVRSSASFSVIEMPYKNINSELPTSTTSVSYP